MGSATAISSICDGANPLTWLITRIGTIGNGIGMIAIAALAIVLAVWNRKRILKEASDLHTAENAEA